MSHMHANEQLVYSMYVCIHCSIVTDHIKKIADTLTSLPLSYYLKFYLRNDVINHRCASNNSYGRMRSNRIPQEVHRAPMLNVQQ